MAGPKIEPPNRARLRADLLAWYDGHRRDLPWRRTRDPYAIWVSEIMLQQTRVAAVIDRFKAFMARFPTVDALARATEEDVLALWSGLGYYRRARMLHKAARQVVSQFDGVLPQTSAQLRDLPGIGSYTAAAIASIAHGERVAVVDGNVERVLCRLSGREFNGRHSAGALRKQIEGLASQFVDPGRPGEFNQAMMELGATVCLPRNPQCIVCPLIANCATRGEHKTKARPKMQNREVFYGLGMRGTVSRGVDRRQVLLELRSASLTVMPGMWELPPLRNTDCTDEHLRMTVRHAIMQVNYTVRIRTLLEEEVGDLTLPSASRRWVPLRELPSLPLTGLARKVLTRANLLHTKSPRTNRATVSPEMA